MVKISKKVNSGIKSGIKITVENYRNKIRLRWTQSTNRYVLNLGLINTPKNLEYANLVSQQIISDIAADVFDPTLLKYKPKKVEVLSHNQFVRLFEHWIEQVLHQNLKASQKYLKIVKIFNSWEPFIPEKIESYLDKLGLTPYEFNKLLAIIKRFYKWLVKQRYLTVDFTLNIEKKIYRKQHDPSRQPLSGEELSLILKAVKDDVFSKSKAFPHSHYYPFLYFLIATGVRNQEAIGLKVQYVNLEKGIVTIAEAYAMIAGKSHARHWKSTKNGKIRELPLSEELKKIISPLLIGKKADDLVFHSQKGTFINDRNFANRVLNPVLQGLNIQHRDIYCFRHSFASRALEQGLDILTVSYMMGNNPDTMLKHYAKLIHKPKNLPTF